MVDPSKQPGAVHYPPLTHWEEHHATFTTPHLQHSALQCSLRKPLRFLLYIVSFFLYRASFHFCVYHSHLVGQPLCKTRSLRANWFCSLLQFASKLGRSVLWIWNMTSLLLCLNGGCYVTSAIRNQREYNKRKTNVERCLAFKSNQMCFDHNNVRLVWISHYIETINLLLTLCQRPVRLCGFDMRECKSNSLIQTISEIM